MFISFERGQPSMFLRWTIAFVLVFVVLLTMRDDRIVCGVSADHVNPIDFCFETKITITNNTGADLTNKPIRALINADNLIDNGQIDERNWDFTASHSAINNNIDVMGQNLGSTAAPFWLWLDSLAAGESTDIRVLHGSPSQHHDNGFFLNGYPNPLSIPHSASIDAGGETFYQIDIVASFRDLTVNSGELLRKADSLPGSGWRVTLGDIGAGVYGFAWLINSTSCTAAVSNTGRHHWSFVFSQAAGIDVFIYEDGSLINSCDTDEASIGTNTADLRIGNNVSNVIIHKATFTDGGGIQGNYSFDANDVTELTSVSNVFTGTFLDATANNNDGTYSFTENQSNIVVVVNPATLVNVSNFPSVSDANNLVDSVIDGALVVIQPTINSGIVGGILTDLDTYSGNANINPDGPKFALTMAVGLGLAILLFGITRFPPLAVVAMGTPVGIGALAGWYNPFWALTLVIALPIIWFGTTKILETSSS